VVAALTVQDQVKLYNV